MSKFNIKSYKSDYLPLSTDNRLVANLPLPHVYYHAYSRDNFIPEEGRFGWIRVNDTSVIHYLADLGFTNARRMNQVINEVDEAFLKVKTKQNVYYAGALAGRMTGIYECEKRRILVTEPPCFVTPQKGEWTTIRQFAKNLFGDALKYVYGWLKVALEMYGSEKWMPGQALILAGPPGAGKNLWVDVVLTPLLGGRAADPFPYMSGAVRFNDELFGAEVLVSHDRAESTNIDSRKTFAGHLKGFTVNATHRYERKHCDALTMNPRWRVVITLNDGPERLRVIPPIDDDIADKLMLLRVFKRPLPYSSEDTVKRIKEELPAFAWFLMHEWTIADADHSDRFGVTHYHDTYLLDTLQETQPEERLRELILKAFPFRHDAWEGTALELQLELKNDDELKGEAGNLLKGTNSCGTYLARLAQNYPEEFSKERKVNNTFIWKIVLKEWGENANAAIASRAETQAKLRQLLSRPRAQGAKSKDS